MQLSQYEGVGAISELYNGGKDARDWLAAKITDKKLDLEGLGLVEVPEEIENFADLETLSFKHNKISVVPPSLCRLPKLHQLRLGRNQIEDLPDEMRYLQSLRSLYLSNNKLGILPKACLQLTNLHTLEWTRISANG